MFVLVLFSWLGNIFFCNFLYELYGIELSIFYWEFGCSLDENWVIYLVVKMYLFLYELLQELQVVKVVYIIWDGRDVLVFLVYYCKDIIELGINYYNNLLELIIVEEGSYFGGWFRNVVEWIVWVMIVICYEDLINDFIKEIEKLWVIMDLLFSWEECLLSFKDLKFGKF